MENDGVEPKQELEAMVDYATIAANVSADEIEQVADFQRSILPKVLVSLEDHPMFSSIRAAGKLAARTVDKRFAASSSAELAGQTSSSLASVLKFSVEFNEDMAKIHELTLRNEIASPKRYGLSTDQSRMNTPYLMQAAKLAARKYADRQAFSTLLADVVKTIQAMPPQAMGMSEPEKKTPEDEWIKLAADVEQLADEAGASEEEVDTFLQANPELQNVVEELIQVVDFTDPIQRTRIIQAMKLLTYLMFFAVIIGSWHLVASYASIISLMGMSAPNVAKAVGDGTEKLLNKISPLPKDDAKD